MAGDFCGVEGGIYKMVAGKRSLFKPFTNCLGQSVGETCGLPHHNAAILFGGSKPPPYG